MMPRRFQIARFTSPPIAMPPIQMMISIPRIAPPAYNHIFFIIDALLFPDIVIIDMILNVNRRALYRRDFRV
jgi:hypothetical protein